jgi:molecular chaperone HscA
MAKIAINIATGSLQQEEIIVGIDLGTTNSLVAIIHPETKKAVALKEHDSSSLVPSVIHFGPAGEVTVGEAARAFLLTEPENTIFSAKRLMGKSYKDVKSNQAYFSYSIIDDDTDSLVKVKVGDRFYSPIELSAFILKELKHRAEHIVKTPVNKAVITVPAYFNDAQRQATRDAGKLAGLDVLRIINEPTAASLAYGIGLDKSEHKTIAVYDLGGGTFDVSILRINDGVIDVCATNGDTYLGGDDFDRAIMQHWMTEHQITETMLREDIALAQALRLHAEMAKRVLSTDAEFVITLGDKRLSLTIAQFEALILPMVERTITCCTRALSDAGMGADAIDAVVMVGGSTRVPLVNRMVSAYFGKPLNNTLNPDEVVALGAAIQADILAGNNKDFLLLDITPLSLGVETMGGLMDVLIPRNSKIPSKVTRQYTTQKDGQSGIVVGVFQGERDLVKDNRKLAAFTLTGIPAMPAGLPKVDISFLINADGILSVGAKELRSGVEQVIEVKPQYGLTDEEVEQMLLNSITNAKADIATRALVEARTEGEQLLQTTEQFIQKNAAHLTREELMTTAEAMQALQLAITMEDKNLIQQKIEALNELSRPYAERIMDMAIGMAMKGNKI